MEREDFLKQIDEQEQWAARALSGVQESALFSAPAASDADFLVRVRERIEKNSTAGSKPQFLSIRRLAWVASACVILLVAIIAGGRFGGTDVGTSQDLTEQIAATENNTSADVATMTTDNVVDSLADADVDATELAAYLDVPDYVEEDAADSADDSPLTDQLLALDTGTLEEVLNNLEGTRFF
jgi:hypothetical protein